MGQKTQNNKKKMKNSSKIIKFFKKKAIYIYKKNI